MEWPLTIAYADLNSIAKANGFRLGNIHYYLVNDEALRNINHKHLQHDYYTDIITFPYSIGKRLQADIHVSLDRIQENAQLNNVHISEELARVIIHGILHLCGYSDHSEEEKIEMREQENKWLTLLFHVKQTKR